MSWGGGGLDGLGTPGKQGGGEPDGNGEGLSRSTCCVPPPARPRRSPARVERPGGLGGARGRRRERPPPRRALHVPARPRPRPRSRLVPVPAGPGPARPGPAPPGPRLGAGGRAAAARPVAPGPPRPGRGGTAGRGQLSAAQAGLPSPVQNAGSLRHFPPSPKQEWIIFGGFKIEEKEKDGI